MLRIPRTSAEDFSPEKWKQDKEDLEESERSLDVEKAFLPS